MRGRVVTLTSDIGPVYAAQMKGVLLQYLDPGRIVELADDLPAHRVAEAAFLLRHMAAGFPRGTVHVAVVDPGVGGARAPVAVRCRDGSHLVGPDNGVLYPLARHLGVSKVVRLSPERIRPGATVSPTFEGRDLFAPAAGRIALGTPIARLGRAWELAPLELPEARQLDGRADGEVVHVDRFGNLITNVPTPWAPPAGTDVRVRVGGRTRRLQRARTYEDLPVRGVGLLGSSFGTLEVSVREGRAADRLGAGVSDAVEFWWPDRRQTRK
jgi:S-adenosylmethionine hydrolase